MKFEADKFKLDAYTVNIIVWNLVPYLGVLFLKWEPLTVFACYAFETIVVGIFNIFNDLWIDTGKTGKVDMNPVNGETT